MNTPNPSTTRAAARVALVTCAELPDLDEPERLVIPALAAIGVTAEPVVWDDAAIDWTAYDLVVLRCPWDYVDRRDAFVTWAKSVARLANPGDIVEWNTDKRYLAELAASGVPVIPTTFVSPYEVWLPPSVGGDYVIKPAIGAGSRDAARYTARQQDAAIEHLSRLQRDGRLSMVQPYLQAVDNHGETALLYFADPAGGRLVFSHAVRKGPMLRDSGSVVTGLYRDEEITARVPTEQELAVGDAVLMALPTGLLYARIDLIPDAEGNPVLVEVELTEPSLFLDHSPGAAERFAASIAAAA